MEPILKYYKRWGDSIHLFMPPGLSAQNFRGCHTEMIFRDDRERLVIEQIIFPPGHELPNHRHPNVSVLDFGISGNGTFSLGKHCFSNDETNRARLPFYVKRNAPHGGVTGDKGAMIVSFQYWYEWPPKDSIFLDWELA